VTRNKDGEWTRDRIAGEENSRCKDSKIEQKGKNVK
jgi:hypothetical protein